MGPGRATEQPPRNTSQRPDHMKLLVGSAGSAPPPASSRGRRRWPGVPPHARSSWMFSQQHWNAQRIIKQRIKQRAVKWR